jgi:hypothetical protein
MMTLLVPTHSAANPKLEAMDNHRTRVSWQGAATPEMIDGLEVTYCRDGMMWLGPINTPVRYHEVPAGQGEHALELEISLAGLKMLHAPQREHGYSAVMTFAR